VFSVLAVCFFLLFLGKRSMLFPLLFLLGYFINAFSGIINAYTADQLPPQVLGKAYGIMFTFSICVSALAPYVMGVISDHTSLAMSMLFLSGVSVMGLLTALINPKKFVMR
jgi:MFS family permease